ncbi:MAG: glycosyltransferase family 2 protein [Methylococcaceae bacterium]|nr:glycosyltransferase family 2 protein [Methylococcaceae bacterium]
MNKPEVSILIVSFNTCERLRQCLTSLPAARGPITTDTIVVDNDSKDGSAELVSKEFPAVRLIRSPVNLGFARANNQAWEIARGRYLLLLNPDAVLSDGTLAHAIGLMDRHPQVGMAGGRLVDENGHDQPSARMFPTLPIEFFNLSGLAGRFPKSRLFGRFDRSWADPDQPGEVDWVPGAFAILRREAIEQTGFFDPRFFLYYEEVDLCRRIKAAGYCIMYWPELRIMHVGGESSKTLADMQFSSKGSQLTLWRMRSQLLYYRKWHGAISAWAVKTLEQAWHVLRCLRNKRRSPGKFAESEIIVKLWNRAWTDTQGGASSPSQPW